MILSIVVGLNARADGLQDEGVMFSQNGDVPFRSEDGFFLSCFGNCLFNSVGVLRLMGMKDERLPSGVMAVEVFVGMFPVFV